MLDKADVTHIIVGVSAPAIVFFIKILIDFNMAKMAVKYLHLLPVRWMFRTKPINVSGVWQQKWGRGGSDNFVNGDDRISDTVIKQFGIYCYAEFYSKEIKYALFGKIVNNYIIGEWCDSSCGNNYFGSFQLRIVSEKKMEGKWVGHSLEKCVVQQDDWVFNKKNN